jgi:hypothetical protein
MMCDLEILYCGGVKLGKLQKCVLATVFVFSGFSASAATISGLNDGFEGEGDPGSSLNYNSFTNWDVTNGTVDIIKTGGFGIDCQSGSYCVDLDGSTSNAGVLTTKDDFASGSYVLSFDLSGNQRGGAADTVVVNFGNLSESITLNSNDPWTTYMRNVTLASAGKLSFDHAGGDNFGIILDNVIVKPSDNGPSPIPLPAGVWLMLASIGSLAVVRRKRRCEQA